MPKYNFGDKENRVFEVVPKGDHIVEVISGESGIKSKGKCNGSDFLSIKLRVETNPNCTFEEELIFHPNCEWRIDTFLKSMNFLINGRPIQKGDDVDINVGNVIGLRGWATLGIRTWDKLDDKGNKMGEGKVNEVITWITNKEKLSRNVPAQQAEPAPQEEEGPLF
jgi:hypothetical protein